MSAARFTIHPATSADAAGIAEAHVDSIRSLGPSAYDRELVANWDAPRTADRYLLAMARRTGHGRHCGYQLALRSARIIVGVPPSTTIV